MDIEQIRQDIKGTYDCVAAKYHELFHDEMKEKEFDRALLDQFALAFNKDSRLCDLGCGPSGHITRYLFEKGLKIEGIDISEQCIEIAKKENRSIEFYVKDMMRLDYPDGLFDGLISFYSIIHTPKDYLHLIFREFNRILKKGGKALVVVKKGEQEGYIDEMLGYKTKIYFTHFLEMEIESYLTGNGFKLKYLETREPYEFEIGVPRIYALAEKI